MMGKSIIVQGDRVQGSDEHEVAGTYTTPSGSVQGTWKASYAYDGKVADGLSRFVRIAGRPVALRSSGCTLPPPGHDATSPTNKALLVPVPETLTAFVTQPDGKGLPSKGAGSAFVRVGGTAVLLDGDGFDTCGTTPGQGNSTVSAGGQDFVRCSA
jgi:uncharacterized Zn-binding protein involved in type VI secretion